MDTNIKAIVFDLGNVLVDFDHMIAAGKMATLTNQSPEEIFSLFFNSGITQAFEAGKVNPNRFYLEVKRLLKSEFTYDLFLPIWNEIFFLSEKNNKVYQLAAQLKEKYKIALLSNVNVLHFEYIKDKFPLFSIFDQIFLSYELGLTKPDKLIYQKVLQELALDPAEVFYTDDRPELVEAACGLGIQGFQFSSVEQLEKDLMQAGVSVG